MEDRCGASFAATGLRAARKRVEGPVLRVGGPARRAVAAGAAGAALGLAFPPYGAWVVAYPAVGALSLLVRGLRPRQGALVGFAFGLGFFGVLLRWMAVVGPDAMAGLALLEAAFFAPLGAVLALTSRSAAWPAWHAAAWVLQEALRARLPFGGLPWGKLAFSQPDGPPAPLAALGGSPLVSFATAAGGVALAAAALAVCRPATRGVAGTALASAGVVAALAGAAAVVPLPVAGDRTATVAIVQGNVPRLGFDVDEQAAAVFNNHVTATRQLADAIRRGELPRPDMVIWPENGTDVDPFDDELTGARIDAAVADLGVPTLIGAVLDADEDHVLNAGVVWTPGQGAGERYVKRHPVPFGEYVPFRPALTKVVGRLSMVPRDFRAGTEVGVLDIGGTTIGEVICFEVAYDGLVRDAVRAGGRLLVVQTNNATYGRTGQPEQQLAISRLRTIEHGRAMAIASTSGISAVIAPDGRVVRRSAEFTRDLIVAPVPLRAGTTVATRVGVWPELALALLAGVGIVICVPRRTGRVASPAPVTVIESGDQPDRTVSSGKKG